MPEWSRRSTTAGVARSQATGMKHPVVEAVERGDLDALGRLVDGLAASRDWPAMVDLRVRCRHPLERGLQLWPTPESAEHRLALDAPPAFAGPVVTETAG